MKNNKTNSLIISRNKYRTNDEFKNAIRDAIMLLLDAGYIAMVRYIENGSCAISIDYGYDDANNNNDYSRLSYSNEDLSFSEEEEWKIAYPKNGY